MSVLRFLGNLQQPLLALADRGMTRWKPLPKGDIPAKRPEPIPATSISEITSVLETLASKAPEWAAMNPTSRARLLRACLDTTIAVSEEAAAAATAAKGSFGTGIGEELLTFIPIVTGIREYAETLEAGGSPKPHRLWRRTDTATGHPQWVADVFPLGLESLLFGGMTGELWLEPGAEPTQGLCYRDGSACPSGVTLVLGAGNQTPVAALDILHALVADNHVVVCKMNPVNEYMGPFLRRAFAPLVDAGFLEFIYGGGAEGAAACDNPAVAAVHLTGSSATYDAIVWRGTAKAPGATPPFTKPVGAELGCVTPYIIVPGRWSASDLAYHAETVATGLTNNAGHNCVKAEVVVTDAEWPQREEFLTALRRALADTPARTAWYPGSADKLAAFRKRMPRAEAVVAADADADGGAESTRQPWVLAAGLTPEEAVTDVENWCGVLQEVALPGCGGDAAKFLDAAVSFANDRCWGTLSCTVIAHPATQRAHKEKFEAAIEGLRYGTVCINVPGTVGFAITKLAWGGWPGAAVDDIRSGDAKVHNTLLFDAVQKSVLRGAWRAAPHPFWFADHRNPEGMARKALRWMARPSLLGVLPLAGEAVKG